MSEMKSSDEVDSPVLMKNRTVDALVAVLLFVIATVVVVEARRLGSGWTSDGPGSGYFPFYIGLILGFSALGIFYQAVFSRHRDDGAFVDRLQATRRVVECEIKHQDPAPSRRAGSGDSGPHRAATQYSHRFDLTIHIHLLLIG